MNKGIVARWQDWSGRGVEHAVISRDSDSNTVDSVVVGGSEEKPFAVRYRLRCDRSWTLAEAEVELIGANAKVHLSSDGRGNWTDGPGNALSHLRDAIDIDLSVTPFTNTLPIQRLRLQKGQSADIMTAYVSFPDLAIVRDPQRYTCLEPMRLYRYESLDSDFVREIEVDTDGLVVTYPGLFRRLL